MDEVEIGSFSIKKLQNKKDFLVYIGNEGIFRDLQIFASEYETIISNTAKKGKFIPSFRFQLKLDLIKIQEISENLHFLFMKELEAGLELAREVIYFALVLIIQTVNLSIYDIQIVPLVLNLPLTNDISDLLHCPSNELESIQGVLVARTTQRKYVRSSVFSCTLYCLGKKFRISSNNFDNLCPECYGHMEEDVSSLDTGEEIICQLISSKTYQCKGRFQVLNVKIKDELCNAVDLTIGDEYFVTGRLKNGYFEAMNVQSIKLDPEIFLNYIDINSLTLPESIANLYIQISDKCPNSPWSFVFALSSMLGSDLIPTSSFLHLKTGLLLSLSSQKNGESPVPLIAVGADSLNTKYLFDAAGKLAERYIWRFTAHSYLGGTAKPRPQSDVIWQEAGQLVLAAKGVCNLGDWSKFKNEQVNYICQTIESGQIMMNKGELEKTNLVDFARLKCAVWTYWCHITQSRNDQLRLKTLINVFGMPFLAQENDKTEMHKICWKNIEKGMKSCTITQRSAEKIPIQDFKEFIGIINSRDLALSDMASQLIRNYFVVSRRERPQCLPMGAIKTITSLAEAHARLALRDEILYEDVVPIIFLYEEAISQFFGESFKSFKKLIWDQKQPIYAFMGQQLHHFRLWLEECFLI